MPHAAQVYSFMGHSSKRGTGSCSGGGMTSKEQRAAMEAFRQPGCRLLVSTSAGEEGIDVPRCEFVVRYNATQTGGQVGRLWLILTWLASFMANRVLLLLWSNG